MTKLPEVMGGGIPEGLEAANDFAAIPIDSASFFPTGSIEIHFPAPRGNDTLLNKAEAAALTRAANAAPVLRRNFIDGITPVFRNNLPGKGMVEIMVPSSPYAYGGVMVVSAGEKLLTTEHADLTDLEVSTETAFDLEPELRQEYYRQILASIQAEEDVALPRRDMDGRVIAYENTVLSISNEQHRLPRTIVLPHMHIIKSGDWINGKVLPPRPLGFELEQRLSRSSDLFTRFKDQWFTPAMQQSDTLDTMSALPSLELRDATPFGYTMATKIAREEPLDQQAQRLSDLLCTHHQVITEFAESEVQRVDESRAKRRKAFMQNSGMILPKLPSIKNMIPLQPSYRTYLYYRDGELTVTISPLLLTTLGAMEGMETAVNRGLQHEKIFTDNELTDFFDRLSDRIDTLLGRNSNAATDQT
jgi:hypothetical protein